VDGERGRLVQRVVARIIETSRPRRTSSERMPNVAENSDRSAATLQLSRARQKNAAARRPNALKLRFDSRAVKNDFEFALVETKR
jgi:hypothetical protein